MGNIEQFQKLLKEKNLKFTFERRAIFAEILKLNKHFDADELYLRLKKRGLRIARDTVYRTMPLLLESGFIQKSVGTGRGEYFERTEIRGHHDHMVCIHCSTVIEFQSEKIEKAQSEVCIENGFDLIFHDHRLFGRCKKCRKS